MQCPKCLQNNTSTINDTHYVCNDPNCVDENGNRTQFYLVTDEKIRFPYNQIFANRGTHEFYRKPLLKINAVKNTSKS